MKFTNDKSKDQLSEQTSKPKNNNFFEAVSDYQLLMGFIFVVWLGAQGMLIMGPNNDMGPNNAEASGNCNEDCESAVAGHVNSIDGKEVNYVKKVGAKKYVVNILDIEHGSHSATIFVDCNCKVTNTDVYR